MPTARETFESSIKDASDLLVHFDALPNPKPPNGEVLKRAGLIMAFTAWETYVEDRVVETVKMRMGNGNGSFSEAFLLRNLEQQLKQFNTPSSEKTLKLFRDFLGLDLLPTWKWNNYDPERVKTELDALVKKRGDAVHRAKPIGPIPLPDLIKRDELEKAIRFLRCLVDATEAATELK